jgi:hypothetical protein
MGYKTVYSVSLYVAKRAAENRYYEKQCFESGPFLIILNVDRISFHSYLLGELSSYGFVNNQYQKK